MNGKHLPLMLLPGLHGEFVQGDVEELDGAVAGGDDALVLVRFGPAEVVEGILRVKPLAQNPSLCVSQDWCWFWGRGHGE